MASESWADMALRPPPEIPLRLRGREPKGVWLVSSLTPDRADPEVVLTTKAAAKQWVKDAHPGLVFSGDDGTGYFVARTPSTDWVARFSIEKVPFGAGKEAAA